MPRKPLIEILWQEMNDSNAWVIITAAIGAVSLYMLLTKKNNPRNIRGDDGRNNDLKEGKTSILSRIRERQLKGCRVCITWEVLTENGQWRKLGKETLSKYASDMELYLMCRIKSEKEKNSILGMLKGIEGLIRHRVLFCETEKGYEAFSRQIKPTIVITHDEAQASFLSTVLQNIVLVGGKASRETVTCVTSLQELSQSDI